MAVMWLALLALACEAPSKPLVQPDRPPAPPPDKAEAQGRVLEETPKEHMHDHFGIVMQARDALIRGDLGAAHGPLVWLSQHNYGGEVPNAWGPHLARMQAAARRAEAAASTDALARELVAVAVACGACHLALGRPAQLEPAGFEALDESARERARDRMHRHLWAVERMWEALIAPDGRRFSLAGEVLVEAPAELSTRAPAELERGVKRIQALGKRAIAATTTDSRAEVLANFLGQCANCHRTGGP